MSKKTLTFLAAFLVVASLSLADTIVFHRFPSGEGNAFSIDSDSGAVTISSNLTVSGTINGTVSGGSGSGSSAAYTAGNLTVQTNATVGGTLGVTGASTLSGATVGLATVQTNVTTPAINVAGTATIGVLSASTNATVGGTLGVTGATTLNGALTSDSAITGSSLTASNGATVTLIIPDAGTTNRTFTISGGIITSVSP